MKKPGLSDSSFTIGVAVFAVLVLTGIIVLSRGSGGDSAQGGVVGQEQTSEGQQHIQNGQPHEPYKTNPPNSGPHYTQPAEWGYYDQPLEDEQVVHNLEHGGIWISYKPSALNNSQLEELKKLAKQYSGRIVVSPRTQSDSNLAVVSWTRLEKRDSWDKGIIEQFLKNNLNNSPEKIAR